MDEDAKSRSKELQVELRLETGESVTQRNVPSRLINTAYESRESTVPLSDEEVAALFESSFSSSVETRETDIDETLHEREATTE